MQSTDRFNNSDPQIYFLYFKAGALAHASFKLIDFCI